MVPGYAIKIALAIGLAAAAALGAITLFIKVAATLSEEVPQQSASGKLQTEKRPTSPPEELSLNTAEDKPSSFAAPPATETFANNWKTGNEIKSPDIVALKP
ncbi:MAG TPA: hypothetical protein VNR65_08365, partial [Geobacterales bacterium]|nr:hypothetical protein [Geobacterales bacterium]